MGNAKGKRAEIALAGLEVDVVNGGDELCLVDSFTDELSYYLVKRRLYLAVFFFVGVAHLENQRGLAGAVKVH